MRPLVTVIALCHNHEDYVEEALRSVFLQSYPYVEIIVVDDASQDGSSEIIQRLIRERQDNTRFLSFERNIGNCKAFNEALKQANGTFIVDFATDDVMLPDMLKEMVEAFEGLPDQYGLVFSNAEYIDDQGVFLKNHFKADEIVPYGDVYREVVKRYFIAPPAMMSRKSMLETLGGYDETLAYEDFDLWIRAARNFSFYYMDQLTIRKRIHSKALSNSFYSSKSGLQESTYRVCEKIKWLNRSEEENRALRYRARYEMRVACLTGNFDLFYSYRDLVSGRGASIEERFLAFLAFVRLDLSVLYRFARRIRIFIS